MARSLEQCLRLLEAENKPTFPKYEPGGELWCNATWDHFLCWPAIPANTSYVLPCPPIRGLIHGRTVEKFCHESGRWRGRDENDYNQSSGYTDYFPCMLFDVELWKDAKDVAASARTIEFIGLTLSLSSLVVAVTIFSYYKRLHVFRNRIHRQLMIVMLCNVIVRLILYIDQSITRGFWVSSQTETEHTIHTTIIVCEFFYIFLEYLKTVAFAFMFIEGYNLHNTVVVRVFQDSDTSLWKFVAFGWGMPAIHVIIWALVVLSMRSFKFEVCLGDYYIQPEYWIMNGVRMAELVVNVGFLLKVVWVLWILVREADTMNEFSQIKKSVKAALMLIPLLGIPNIMQTIPFIPSRDNLPYFAAFTYTASFFFMYQGFMIAVLYCFTNREVIGVMKSHWSRYRLRHTSADTLRRGSRAPSVFYRTTTTARVPSGDSESSMDGNNPRRSSDCRDASLTFNRSNTNESSPSACFVCCRKSSAISNDKPKDERPRTLKNKNSCNNNCSNNNQLSAQFSKRRSWENRQTPALPNDSVIKTCELKPLFVDHADRETPVFTQPVDLDEKLNNATIGFLSTVRRWLNSQR